MDSRKVACIVYLKPESRARIKRYAAKHNKTMSLVMAELMHEGIKKLHLEGSDHP